MFRRNSDGIAVSASVRMNDGAILIGTINCGTSGRLENLLSGDSSFIEFVSKDGQQRFVARHQVTSIEPLAVISEPCLPDLAEQTDPFDLLGVKHGDSVETALAMFQRKLHAYHPERWSGDDIPFEFARYASEKTRQLNMAFTEVRAALQAEAQERAEARRPKPYFGVNRAAI
jgi:hypothetical protein